MKRRLDQYLSEEELCESREKAKRAVLAGVVRINGQRAYKPSDMVEDADHVELIQPNKYVSRGGHKLEQAIQHFGISIDGATAVDLGASTGGFTDCLLQHGATKVYAIDVGKGQMAWKLRQNSRVVVMDQTNARHLRRQQMPPPFESADLAAIDCSFISLGKILPSAIDLTSPSGKIIALIKPQFEAGKAAVDRGRGVIRDPKIHEHVIQNLQHYVASQPDLHWIGTTESPILGPAGNKEFLCLIEKSHASDPSNRTHCQSGKSPLGGESTEGGRVDS